MSPETVRSVLDQLRDPAYRDMFLDVLAKDATASASDEPPGARELSGQQAEAMAGELADAIAAEPAVQDAGARELVAA